jgi:AraC family ethanolamine operon transcriptional activator
MNLDRVIPHESEMLSVMTKEMGWDIHYDQLDRGRFGGEIQCAATRDAQFFREHYTRRLRVHGAVPDGVAVVFIPVSARGPVRFRGELVPPGSVCLMVAGDEGSLELPADHAFVNCCISNARLAQALDSVHGLSLRHALPETQVRPVRPALVTRLRDRLQSVFNELQAPAHHLDPTRADQALENGVVLALCDILGGTEKPAAPSLAPRNRWNCVSRVSDYINRHLAEPLYLETLCRVAGVRARTLENAFLEVTGDTPMRFISLRRLNAARHALASATPGETSVKAVALSCGFWHFGRFAQEYGALFGEAPSATLAQAAQRFW